MLYRYPIEQKKTAQETTVGNRRYETDTGAELPPVPYINTTAKPQSSAVVKASSTASKQTNGKTAAKNTAQTVKNTSADNNIAALQKALLEAQQKALLAEQKKAELDRQYAQGKDTLKNNYEAQLQMAQMSSDDIMRQLYIAYMQGIKNMSQQQASWGAGGEIESIKSRHRTNYEENRAKQNRSYSGIIGEIEQKYNSDLMALEEKYLKQLMSL